MQNINWSKVDTSRVGDWFMYDTDTGQVLGYGATPIAAAWACGFGPKDVGRTGVVMSRVMGTKARGGVSLPEMDCCRRAVEGVLEHLHSEHLSLQANIREQADKEFRERAEAVNALSEWK